MVYREVYKRLGTIISNEVVELCELCTFTVASKFSGRPMQLGHLQARLSAARSKVSIWVLANPNSPWR